MATGYTAIIEKGVTFRQFALGCARAFGALVTMRDDAPDVEIPEKFEPDDYNQKSLKEAVDELNRLNAMTDEQLSEAYSKQYNASLEGYNESLRKKTELKEKYESMLKEVEAWTPPTADHNGLKKFMAQQINESIKWDCDYEPTPPKMLTPREWYHERRDYLLRQIEYHDSEHQKEIERVEARNKWIEQLRQSLS
jgi:hypothetical protein